MHDGGMDGSWISELGELLCLLGCRARCLWGWEGWRLERTQRISRWLPAVWYLVVQDGERTSTRFVGSSVVLLCSECAIFKKRKKEDPGNYNRHCHSVM